MITFYLKIQYNKEENQFCKEVKGAVITNGDVTDNVDINRPDNEKFQKMLEDIALKKQQEETALLSRESIRLIRVKEIFLSRIVDTGL